MRYKERRSKTQRRQNRGEAWHRSPLVTKSLLTTQASRQRSSRSDTWATQAQEAGSHRLVSRPRSLGEDSRLLTKRGHILMDGRCFLDARGECNAIMEEARDAERACLSIVVEMGMFKEVCPVSVASVFRCWWADVADSCRALCESNSRWPCSGNELCSVGRVCIGVWEVLHRGCQSLGISAAYKKEGHALSFTKAPIVHITRSHASHTWVLDYLLRLY